MILSLVLTAVDAIAVAEELSAVFDEWDCKPSTEPVSLDELPEEVRKSIDPVAVTALIVSIPSAGLAVADLADRVRKRRRATRLIQWADEKQQESSVAVYVVVAGKTELLNKLDPDQLLDLASES